MCWSAASPRAPDRGARPGRQGQHRPDARAPSGTEELKKEIQEYVKKHTAPYKYPRIVEFRDELPKTISGKIIRNKL